MIQHSQRIKNEKGHRFGYWRLLAHKDYNFSTAMRKKAGMGLEEMELTQVVFLGVYL